MKPFITYINNGELLITLHDGTTDNGSICPNFLAMNNDSNRKYFYYLKVINTPKYCSTDTSKIRDWITKHCPEYNFYYSLNEDTCDFPTCKDSDEYTIKEQLQLLIKAMNCEYKKLYPDEFVQETNSALSFLKNG